ncbi:hypothetical protein SeMB42_g00813 [Synchytrium endobioticum]|uniref:LysM domain-containing protein n=1 Tax=Synchytrium endobioticum TaxID=286115 RepID=A0A507DJZ7_9FUNG|nr:hypothetical protein SeLEV6574_g00021 [Synchytrium endobioticum]TPX51851.1 hypothetical protein SeLEV6574_g00024 [Synchytrium endobioticum]TPX53401.1 hypothetical protein SeMB42_g00813 [Synchytrium endobioticum]
MYFRTLVLLSIMAICYAVDPICISGGTVKDGDTCERIANSLGVTVKKLESWNPSIDCAKIDQNVGHKMCLHLPHISWSAAPTAPSACRALILAAPLVVLFPMFW